MQIVVLVVSWSSYILQLSGRLLVDIFRFDGLQVRLLTRPSFLFCLVRRGNSSLVWAPEGSRLGSDKVLSSIQHSLKPYQSPCPLCWKTPLSMIAASSMLHCSDTIGQKMSGAQFPNKMLRIRIWYDQECFWKLQMSFQMFLLGDLQLILVLDWQLTKNIYFL